MCPQAPVSIPLDGGDVGSTDEEVVLFLGRRRVGDPIPSNVISDVNPFSIDPRNSPEGIWFLYTSKDSQSHDGGIIKVINGYWRSMDDCRILTAIRTVGRKTTREFYVGQAPIGDRTGWKMQEYCAEQIAAESNNKSQDNSTLCRFFLQNDESSDNGEQCDPVTQNVADCEYIEHMLLGFLEQDERNPSPRNAGNGSQVAGEDEQRQQESSSRPQDSISGNSMEGMQDDYDFSKEDFLELRDLYDPMSPSSSSDNSSLMSMNSDECFDAEALLRDIENEGGLDTEEHVDYRFSITTSVRSDQVVIQPPPPAFANNSSLVVSESEATNSTPAVNPALPSSTVDLQNDDASTSGSSQGGHRSGSHSGSSRGGSPSERSRSKSVRRMAKLGKRYCCFGGSF